MSDLLDRMTRNPAGDWTIAGIEKLCRAHGIACIPPSGGGSHHKVAHAMQTEILTIPARRPIKVVYIRKPVRFVMAIGEQR